MPNNSWRYLIRVVTMTILLAVTVPVLADELDNAEREALNAAQVEQQAASDTAAGSTASKLDSFLQFDPAKNDSRFSSIERLSFLTGADDPVSVSIRLVNTALGFLGMLSTLLMLYGGVIWFMSRDNEERVEQAKEIIKGTVIGLIITMLALSVSLLTFNLIQDVVSSDTASEQ
ncbi:MAG: hypothetical protein HYV33_06150 [Candidatus Kerfeldbacteria bacterium]|nr:hypothetical protein [Candidatus Kerfeldbacteria bacterium]